MDKLEILVDMTEHPEHYTEQQMEELLADENATSSCPLSTAWQPF